MLCYIKIHWSIFGWFLFIYGFATSNIDHLGNIGPLSYEGLANTDIFNNIIVKNHIC